MDKQLQAIFGTFDQQLRREDLNPLVRLQVFNVTDPLDKRWEMSTMITFKDSLKDLMSNQVDVCIR